jgi:hypothetical protein
MAVSPELEATPASIRLKYAGAIGLLAEIAVLLKHSAQSERDSIENAIADWCAESGWTYTRTLDRFDLEAPDEE